MALTKLDEKLARIRKDPSGAKDFIICDAGDGDMGGGITMPGLRADGSQSHRPLQDYLKNIEDLVAQAEIDLALLSINSLERLTRKGVFSGSSVATAIRANDTTDIWGARHARYKSQISLPHRSALIEHAMHGRLNTEPGTPPSLTGLGLYSITFMNDAEVDSYAVDCYRDFRIEAEHWGFRHFLEVFNPNIGADDWSAEEIGQFVNDNIVRVLAPIPDAQRPQFLKIVYNGRRPLEELVAYDPTIVVGILGGGAGTTRDTFELIKAGQDGGARVALFGRKINLSEDPRSLVTLMRAVVNGEIRPEDAVRAYHGALDNKRIKPARNLSQDLEITEPALR